MSGGFELIGIHHVQLAMPEGEDADAVRFYADTLGLTQVPRPEALSPRGGVWFMSGDLEVHLGVEDRFHPAVKAHPAILVKGLDTIRARIEEAGYKVSDTVQIEGFDRLYVRDPFGNRLELIEAL
ncbi:MAG: VOC family protein [Actinobacteria bacterium]|nr:VOC family protein [Actinomycetota bacterium]